MDKSFTTPPRKGENFRIALPDGDFWRAGIKENSFSTEDEACAAAVEMDKTSPIDHEHGWCVWEWTDGRWTNITCHCPAGVAS